MVNPKRIPITILAAFMLLVSCNENNLQPPEFNKLRSFSYLEDQVAFGPRVPGTKKSALARNYYYAHFKQCGLVVDSQAFEFYDPYSLGDKPLVNIIASYNAKGSSYGRIALVAHFDSRPRTDSAKDSTLRDTPIDGANDGASGVAILLELANLLAERPPDVSVDLVLVDGEDWGKAGDTEYYLLGSNEFARRGIHERYDFAIVIDMVGDSDQRIYREGYSEAFNKPLNDMVWSVAAKLNISALVDSVKYTILDDHLPINAGGVPAIVIIDFDYEFWHTEFDTPDKCSPDALENIGRILAKIIYNPDLWPQPR